MLPPKHRASHGRWLCPACGAELGRLKQVAGLGGLLHPTGLINARRADERGAWWLTCPKGHVTRWSGDVQIPVASAA